MPELGEFLEDGLGGVGGVGPEGEVEHGEIEFVFVVDHLLGRLALAEELEVGVDLLDGVDVDEPGDGLEERFVPSPLLLEARLMPQRHPPGLTAAIDIREFDACPVEIGSETDGRPEQSQLLFEEGSVAANGRFDILQDDFGRFPVELHGTPGG